MADRKLIGQILKNLGLINEKQLDEALEISKQSKEKLGKILIKLGYINNNELTKALAAQFGMPPIALSSTKIPIDVISLIPPPMARRHRIIPVKHINNTLTVAVDDALNLFAIDNLRIMLKCNIECVMATEEEMSAMLDRYYESEKATVDTVVQELTEEDVSVKEEETGIEEADDVPIIKLVNLVMLEAFRSRASDIHIEPMETKLRVRYRIDGVLREVPGPPKRLQGSIISRIKLMAGMDIAEKRLPQDGRIKITLMNKDLDLRVSALPATYGESVVMRILDKSSLLLGLGELGFLQEDEDKFRHLTESPNGVLLVTGPTGSGKTTTLYASLSYINQPNRKLITIEDPVEYQISGINQVQVKTQIGLTFAMGLRSMLRQAPNVIMVGEIRDQETAGIAIQAALTGHLVFSTLHTNDASGAITRLIDMGVKPYLVASAVQAVLAQRLVRLLCPNCKEPYVPKKEELTALKLREEDVKDKPFYRAKGCDDCGHTGYRGRKGIYELLVVTDSVRELIFQKVSSNLIRERARLEGMKTLREDGTKKILLGITTAEEVIRITQSDID